MVEQASFQESSSVSSTLTDTYAGQSSAAGAMAVSGRSGSISIGIDLGTGQLGVSLTEGSTYTYALSSEVTTAAAPTPASLASSPDAAGLSNAPKEQTHRTLGLLQHRHYQKLWLIRTSWHKKPRHRRLMNKATHERRLPKVKTPRWHTTSAPARRNGTWHQDFQAPGWRHRRRNVPTHP